MFLKLSEEFKEQGSEHHLLALPKDTINYHHKK